MIDSNLSESEIPSDTCPYINFAQQILDEIKSDTTSENTEKKIELIHDILEYIRHSNSELRCGLHYWKKEYDNKGKRKKK
tara:strand:+ start:507 stop:746 length:240 start_codon:yes stop_codon:yes gene_type:complete